ncbi:isopenicillin N synthase family dioxygenase [Aspergillus aculeatinus CBS 121060]|uniref:Clavaminate synthase-like protein n=2 Tax=Aspergillus TaxID=5052 RepID=A0A8G1RSJ9_9EURO|nr:Clavaminate synthase-like protein [Aspergillus aculeatinus CBS 121060]XP_040802053.1 Clavaminate synthase-like protein [Aspergillus fijiensis CBS 313.89]RAH70342.1 Clavaminate synthase-like protein [Aspergillus aculeatinus CBS 121060]RAK78043.1 Clavaminate synthase-like protein [Aspergillus fijiensis CBS 313.89]
MAIKSLDFRRYRSDDAQERQQFCDELCETLCVYGFAKIRHSSLPKEKIDQLFEFNKRFFDLPDDIKVKAAHPAAPNPHRGWSAIGQESVWQISKFEQGEQQTDSYQEYRESFDQGAATDELFPNRWVDETDLPGFRPFMEGIYDDFHELHGHLVRAITAGLRLPADHLIAKHQSNTSELRLLHYPAIPARSMGSGKRIGEHSDFGTLTLLLQDSVGGLQVEDQRQLGSFIPVESENVYEVIINVGDCLQRWTNKQLRSANHRVCLPQGTDVHSTAMLAPRYSVAYFGKPDREVLVDTLPAFVRPGIKSAYNDHLTALEYMQQKLVRTYG